MPQKHRFLRKSHVFPFIYFRTKHLESFYLTKLCSFIGNVRTILHFRNELSSLFWKSRPFIQINAKNKGWSVSFQKEEDEGKEKQTEGNLRRKFSSFFEYSFLLSGRWKLGRIKEKIHFQR